VNHFTEITYFFPFRSICNTLAYGATTGAGGTTDQPAGGAMGQSDDSTAQLVQAMAGFGGSNGAADGLKTASLSADTSQQTFLTTPHA
jgi:hypothetical protein